MSWTTVICIFATAGMLVLVYAMFLVCAIWSHKKWTKGEER